MSFLESFYGLPISESRVLHTRELAVIKLGGREHLLCHSEHCLALMMAGVVWHDFPEHCPTWTGGDPWVDGRCSCDVEGCS